MGMAMVFLVYGSSFAVQAFTKPVYAIALMLFYYDQRIRKEGFDIEWMMARAGLMPGEAATGVELSAEPGGEGAAPWSVGTPLKMVPMQSKFVGEDAGTASAGTATQTLAQTEAAEAIGMMEPTQRENEVQG